MSDVLILEALCIQPFFPSSHNCIFLQFLDGWVIFAEYAKQREATQPSQQGAPAYD
jgi:hypothetical protein